MVLESRHGADGVRLLDLLIESVGIDVVAVNLHDGRPGGVVDLPRALTRGQVSVMTTGSQS